MRLYCVINLGQSKFSYILFKLVEVVVTVLVDLSTKCSFLAIFSVINSYL